jgi:hypothetical protein
MPSRIVREGINSSRAVSDLSEPSQLFYRTLLLVVDDFGRFEKDLDVIRAICFPRQLDRWPTDRINQCLKEISEARTDKGKNLLTFYRDTETSKEFLLLENFQQRCQRKSKYPAPPGFHDVKTVKGYEMRRGNPPPDDGDEITPAKQPQRQQPPATTPPPPQRTKPAVVAAPPPAPVKTTVPATNGGHELAVAAVSWFDRFWEIYWRKTAKKDAHKAFVEIVRTEEQWNQVKLAIAKQAPQMLTRDVQMRPEAASWLRKERMFDESSPPPINKPPTSVQERNQQRRDNVNKLSKILRSKRS